MKTFLFLFTIGLFSCQLQAQSKTALIETTLQHYIEGSSYNKLDVLESAFTPDATLYLTMRDGFRVLTPKDYVGFFKAPSGTFNGRNGEVLSIEVVKDIATAKVRISIPEKEMVYIDLFLLKETEMGWKIISKTATRVDTHE
jgi:hypothetical protein